MIRVQQKAARAGTTAGTRSAADAPKSRRCLKCRADFLSEWAGQRVCPNCKRKTQWISGALPKSF
jgi:Zn finger protein HypA/HybF involved in hydrogenase expression